jgi:hypothetical protein
MIPIRFSSGALQAFLRDHAMARPEGGSLIENGSYPN